MGWVWGGVIIGIVIVALAVGIPYFHTHRRMRSPRDKATSHQYLRARRNGRLQDGRGPGEGPDGTGSMPESPPESSDSAPGMRP